MGATTFSFYFILFLLFYLIPAIGLWKIFEKAGEDGWKAIVPIYNYYVWLKVVGRPSWWIFLIIVPVLGLFVLAILIIDLLKSFGKFGVWHHALGLFVPFIYLPYLGFSSEVYQGEGSKIERPEERKKSELREWVDAILFAVIAATLIRWFLLEAFTIPTSSMEKSLLVGDFLFVSKVHYGPRIPMTPLAFPLVHNTLPFSDARSYIEQIRIPYKRLPGLETIKNNDVVVFNYPMEEGRPVDKKDNYIKRCLAIPGDEIEVKERDVYINGELLPPPPDVQFLYLVRTTGAGFNRRTLRELNITEHAAGHEPGQFQMLLTNDAFERIQELPYVEEVRPIVMPRGYFDPNIFPHYRELAWNVDNFGPLYVPRAGDTIQLNEENYHIYQHAIQVFENNPGLELRDGQVFRGEEQIPYYVFQLDYYFMMGDNRNNSADSRMWGFVPSDHIVGKPLFIWLSYDTSEDFTSRIRWGRLFSGIR